jgi:hypothetical protein
MRAGAVIPTRPEALCLAVGRQQSFQAVGFVFLVVIFFVPFRLIHRACLELPLDMSLTLFAFEVLDILSTHVAYRLVVFEFPVLSDLFAFCFRLHCCNCFALAFVHLFAKLS